MLFCGPSLKGKRKHESINVGLFSERESDTIMKKGAKQEIKKRRTERR